MIRAALLGWLALVAAPSVASAQAGSASSGNAPPDLTGVYRGGGNDAPPGFTVINPYRGMDELITSLLQPWARARQEATDWDTEDTGQLCQLVGIGRNHSGGYEILTVPGKITLVAPGLETGGVRRIFMTAEHPKNLTPTWNGHSIGRWEGDTLIVDTIGFNDRWWLFSDREPHTEALRLTERIRLVADGQYLEIIATVDDPKALTKPYTYSRYSRRTTNEPRESICNEDTTAWRRMRAEAAAKAGPAAAPRPVAAPPAFVAARPAPRGERTFTGVYELAADGSRLPRGLRPSPQSVEAVPLRPQALAIQATRKPDEDPANQCQAVGPFRMMARPGNRIEIYAQPAKVLMLFEDIARGNKRTIALNRTHPEKLEPTWQGDSVGRWEGDTLVVDTTGFNDRTWLNAAGAPHSEALRLTERIRLVEDGAWLEVRMTADDPLMLTAPVSYTRYYRRVAIDAIQETVCEGTVPPPPVPTSIKSHD